MVRLESFETELEVSVDVLLASVERLIQNEILEYVGPSRGLGATVWFADPAQVPPTDAEIAHILCHHYAELNDPDDGTFTDLREHKRLFLRALLALKVRRRT